MPKRQPKRGRLWLNDGSCIRLRPCWPHHVWAYDFVEDRTHDGRKFRMLTVIDEFTRECLAIEVARHLRSDDVLHRLTDLFIQRGPPDHIRSDNGPEFTANAVREWLAAGRRQDALHRARQSLGERLLRKLQREASRRAARWRDLLHLGGGQVLIESWRRLQRSPAALVARLQAAGPAVLMPARPAAQPRPAPPGAITSPTT